MQSICGLFGLNRVDFNVNITNSCLLMGNVLNAIYVDPSDEVAGSMVRGTT